MAFWAASAASSDVPVTSSLEKVIAAWTWVPRIKKGNSPENVGGIPGFEKGSESVVVSLAV